MDLRNLWLTGLTVAATAVAQLANNPGIASQGPDHYSFFVGDVKRRLCAEEEL